MQIFTIHKRELIKIGIVCLLTFKLIVHSWVAPRGKQTSAEVEYFEDLYHQILKCLGKVSVI